MISPAALPLWVRWSIVIALSVPLGFVMQRFSVPAAWILAAIIVAGSFALTTGQELRANPHVGELSKGVIAIMAATPLVLIAPSELARFILPAVTVSAITIGLCIAGGIALARAHPAISRETGLLSMLSGGASLMPLLAREVGADYRYVTLSQYLRLLIVSISLPLVTGIIGLQPDRSSDPAGGAGAVLHAPLTWTSAIMMLLVIALGTPLARLIRLPAASIFGPMLLTVAVSMLWPGGLILDPPYAAKVVAFLYVGWAAGGQLSVPALRSFRDQLPATLAFIAVLIVGCATTAVLLMWWLDIPYLDAYLATSPGALETVLALADEGQAGAIVVATQVTRLIGILVLAAYLPQLLRLADRLRRRGA